MPAPLQGAPANPLQVLATYGLFALFLALTAHIAARNVLGDVPVARALGVGPVPAAIAFVVTAFDLPPFPGVVSAVVADGVAIHYLYGLDRRLTAYVTLIHVVVSILLGTVLYGVLFFASTLPG